MDGDSDTTSSEVSTPHLCYDFGIFPMYVPEHSYTSSPAASPPPQIHSDEIEPDGLELDLSPTLYTPRLSVIEEECDSICVSHADPLQHIKDHLSIINDELTEMERSLFLKKRMFFFSLLNHSQPNLRNSSKSSHFFHPLRNVKSTEVSRSSEIRKTSPQVITDPSVISENLLEKLQNYQNTLFDLVEYVEFQKTSSCDASSIQDIEDYITSLSNRLNFLQRIVRQNLSEKDAVICLSDACDTCDPVEPMEPIKPIKPLESLEPMELVNPVNTSKKKSEIENDNSERHNPICSPIGSSAYEELVFFLLIIYRQKSLKCCHFSCAIC